MREIKQETVLKRFYTITATNKKGEKVEWNQDDPVPYNRNEFDFCMDYDDSVIVDDMVFLNQEIIDIYNANKDNFKNDESNEKIAWAAWVAAREQSKKKRNDSEPGFYLEID